MNKYESKQAGAELGQAQFDALKLRNLLFSKIHIFEVKFIFFRIFTVVLGYTGPPFIAYQKISKGDTVPLKGGRHYNYKV